MELDKILYDYKTICKCNDKWYKENQPQYMKHVKTSLIVAGCIALVMVISTLSMENVVAKSIIVVFAIAIMGIAFLCSQKYIEKHETAEGANDDNDSSEACPATRKQYRIKQSESLKKVLIDNNVVKNGFDDTDVQRIQILIELIRERKSTAFGLKDLEVFLIRPIVIFVVPMIVVFLDHLTNEQDIVDQLGFFLDLIGIVVILGLIAYMISDPIKYFVCRRYDGLIDGLRALLVFYQ